MKLSRRKAEPPLDVQVVAGAVAVLERLLWAPFHTAACAPGARSCPWALQDCLPWDKLVGTHAPHLTPWDPALLSPLVLLANTGQPGSNWLVPHLLECFPEEDFFLYSFPNCKLWLLPLVSSPSSMSIQRMAPRSRAEHVVRAWQCGTAWHISS